jgi:hypothetical protein
LLGLKIELAKTFLANNDATLGDLARDVQQAPEMVGSLDGLSTFFDALLSIGVLLAIREVGKISRLYLSAHLT